jgi:hypothetical protein
MLSILVAKIIDFIEKNFQKGEKNKSKTKTNSFLIIRNSLVHFSGINFPVFIVALHICQHL